MGFFMLSNFVIFLLLFRILQRIYYLLKGHLHGRFFPNVDIVDFLIRNGLENVVYNFKCKHDGVQVHYRKIGNGSKKVYLANGVGTNFSMWLPVIKNMLRNYPNLFNEITLIAPNYRGLFGSDRNVQVTIEKCAEDAKEILDHLKCDRHTTIIGWSTGAQMALHLCKKYPQAAERVLLLNPSTGKTLHTVLQPFFPLPNIVGKILSSGIHKILLFLRPVCDYKIWDVLKEIMNSSWLYWAFFVGAFVTGAPPEQPDFFLSYMRDVFSTREHTKHLLDLILALDCEALSGSCTLPIKATIVSGLPDFMTGVYHSLDLARGMPNSKHIMFTMGSHFILIEWPELIAQYILDLVFNDGGGDQKKFK